MSHPTELKISDWVETWIDVDEDGFLRNEEGIGRMMRGWFGHIFEENTAIITIQRGLRPGYVRFNFRGKPTPQSRRSIDATYIP